MRPPRRRLRVFAFDPMTTRLTRRFLTISVPFETLSPGPTGRLVHVTDADVTGRQWYVPVDLDDPAVIGQDGLRPMESDPRSHQQMVYAVASSVLERFERALGRRFQWRDGKRLILLPHAFERQNAHFDPTAFAVYFGYFRADDKEPGRNLPGQLVFTCLSMDLVAHEVTHAVVHDLRPHLIRATHPDSRACHEAIADIVALFHHFLFEDVVRDAIANARGDIGSASALFDLAHEFSESRGRTGPMRSAVRPRNTAAPSGGAAPDAPMASIGEPGTSPSSEPHSRGSLLVEAIFAAYIATSQSRIADLLRIATGGTGQLPAGNLHPDLVARVQDS